MRQAKLVKILGVFLLLVGVLICLWFMVLGTAPVIVATRDVTDLSRYQEIQASYEDSPLIQHFPEQIPLEATDVTMEYLPKFMQGGSYFKLSYTLPADQINQLRAYFDGAAQYKYRVDEANQLTEDVSDKFPKPSFQMSIAPKENSLKNYEVFILDIQATGGAESEWNHGYSYGIAIEEASQQVIYWNEYW